MPSVVMSRVQLLGKPSLLRSVGDLTNVGADQIGRVDPLVVEVTSEFNVLRVA